MAGACQEIIDQILKEAERSTNNKELLSIISIRVTNFKEALKNLQSVQPPVDTYQLRLNFIKTQYSIKSLVKRFKIKHLWQASQDAEILYQIDENLETIETIFDIIVPVEIKRKFASKLQKLLRRDKQINNLLGQIKKTQLGQLTEDPFNFTLQISNLLDQDPQQVEVFYNKNKHDILNYILQSLDIELERIASKIKLGFTEYKSEFFSFDKYLTNEMARDFHDQYFAGQYCIPFSYFYQAFKEKMSEFNLEHSEGLEQVIKQQVDTNANFFIEANQLNDFFQNVLQTEEQLAKLKKQAEKYEDGLSKLQFDREIIRSKMGTQFDMEFITLEDANKPWFGVGFKFFITNKGHSESQRFCSDGVTLFGRDGVPCDIYFPYNDLRVSQYQCAIISKSDSYYISDRGSVYATGIKLNHGTVLQLEKDLIIDFGGNSNLFVIEELINEPGCQPLQETLVLETTSVVNDFETFLEGELQQIAPQTKQTKKGKKEEKNQSKETEQVKQNEEGEESSLNVSIGKEPKIRFKGISGEYLGRVVQFISTPQKNEFLVGRKDADQKDFQFNCNSVSRQHAVIKYEPKSGWVLEEKENTNGTIVLLNTYSRYLENRASPCYKLFDGCVIAVAEMRFQVKFLNQS